jgi:hypothetical protein
MTIVYLLFATDADVVGGRRCNRIYLDTEIIHLLDGTECSWIVPGTSNED